MPYGDRTGPRGLGPRTGRGLGLCSGYPTPGYIGYSEGRRVYGGGWWYPSGYEYPAGHGYSASYYSPYNGWRRQGRRGRW